MARKFTLQPLRRYDVKPTKNRHACLVRQPYAGVNFIPLVRDHEFGKLALCTHQSQAQSND
jgi:hypothetical protein